MSDKLQKSSHFGVLFFIFGFCQTVSSYLVTSLILGIFEWINTVTHHDQRE